MYEFRYDYTKNKYGNKSRLLLTGTGSFTYEIETENVIKILVRIENMFDFGNYSNKSKHYDNSKPLVFGKLKDKMGDVAAEKFVGLS